MYNRASYFALSNSIFLIFERISIATVYQVNHFVLLALIILSGWVLDHMMNVRIAFKKKA